MRLRYGIAWVFGQDQIEWSSPVVPFEHDYVSGPPPESRSATEGSWGAPEKVLGHFLHADAWYVLFGMD